MQCLFCSCFFAECAPLRGINVSGVCSAPTFRTFGVRSAPQSGEKNLTEDFFQKNQRLSLKVPFLSAFCETFSSTTYWSGVEKSVSLHNFWSLLHSSSGLRRLDQQVSWLQKEFAPLRAPETLERIPLRSSDPRSAL